LLTRKISGCFYRTSKIQICSIKLTSARNLDLFVILWHRQCFINFSDTYWHHSWKKFSWTEIIYLGKTLQFFCLGLARRFWPFLKQFHVCSYVLQLTISWIPNSTSKVIMGSSSGTEYHPDGKNGFEGHKWMLWPGYSTRQNLADTSNI